MLRKMKMRRRRKRKSRSKSSITRKASHSRFTEAKEIREGKSTHK